MKRLKIIGLAVLLTCAGCSLKIKGRWDPDLPGHFIASTPLEHGDDYIIRNNGHEMLYVWLLDDRTPRAYFPLMPGEARRFESPGDSFDLYSAGEGGRPGLSLWWLPNLLTQ